MAFVLITALAPSLSIAAPRPSAPAEVLQQADHVYVGQLAAGTKAKIVLLVSKDFAVAYVCDNKKLAALVGGRAANGLAKLANTTGAQVAATYTASGATGTFSSPGNSSQAFAALPATGKAGFYVADTNTTAGPLSGRWVVLADGASAGVARLDGVIISNPPFGAVVTIAGSVLHPVKTTVVVGFPSTSLFKSPPRYPTKLPSRRSR